MKGKKENNGATDIVNTMLSAVSDGNIEAIELLISKYGVNAKNNDGITPLYIAAYNNHKDIVELLINNNADVKAKSNNGVTPLSIAVANSYTDIVELLLNNNADVDAKKNNGITPLYIASEEGHKDIVKLLINNKANVNAKNNDEITPLHIAAYNNHKDIVELLINNNADVKAKSNDGTTPLYIASNKGHKDIVELLINNNADVNAKRNDGTTPLHIAAYTARKDSEDIVKLLINNKANVNAKNNNEITPLHIAAENGRKEVVKLLLEKGAKVEDTSLTNQIKNMPGLEKLVEINLFTHELFEKNVTKAEDIAEPLTQDLKTLLGLGSNELQKDEPKEIDPINKDEKDKTNDSLKHVEFFHNCFKNVLSVRVKEAMIKGIQEVQSLISSVHSNMKKTGQFNLNIGIREEDESNATITTAELMYKGSTVESTDMFNSYDDFKASNVISLKFITAMTIGKYIKEESIVQNSESEGIFHYTVVNNDVNHFITEETKSIIEMIQDITFNVALVGAETM